ncbi:nucleotidyl transferase AbiEii/AbiGii toxin family protein [Picrophilus oshimae]|uniref:Nucleotidyl transferase AbiEii toxin, Type IV TA system n=1 Tax=Picrophilus torridus (strain ATCC 700027 / DSM 9790 / JCM 10055 / NBRC 100828 / KAW 2/3) TaxID=1122961 RepID=A0A8G2FXQ2_PICTO|nr:nucleotidyl transferase AbiEii/AbiGii toxin family protein [Picrophilus oshimae]SMD31431.1 hypothetical protein SAMN02745355_1371 [Picrophilus oshimae DSM 9789]
MIDEKTLMQYSYRFQDIRQLEKDYLLTLLLYEIYNEFNDELIFKGGTSLKYFYNLNRFSEDLDFSYLSKKHSLKSIYAKMNRAFKHVNLQYDIINTEHRGHKVGDTVVGINFELRIKGPLYNKLNYMENIDIDLSLRNDVILPPDIKYLVPTYPDIPMFPVPVMNLNEIISEKVASIIERNKMRDIYDLYFLIKFHNLQPDRKLINKKFDMRGNKFNSTDFLNTIENALNSAKWKSELSFLISSLPDSNEVAKIINGAFHNI